MSIKALNVAYKYPTIPEIPKALFLKIINPIFLNLSLLLFQLLLVAI
uniref:Uncharacterized protein n=1 Tax=Meloidogyne enterolobii TaxID=390850 RepID=A0A6V7XJN6_MELEN|nr:unnamed protein product [Meloidogyne enterolobii]